MPSPHLRQDRLLSANPRHLQQPPRLRPAFALEMAAELAEMNPPMPSRSLSRTGALAWLLLAASVSAQPALEERQRAARALEARLPKPGLNTAAAPPLTPARQQRLEQRLPSSWRKLSQREPFHLLVLGDATAVWEQGEDRGPAYPELFARELASLFYYTGGVREAGPPVPGGPSIVLRDLSRAGGSALDAAAILASSARQSPVDLVLLCTGRSEAELGLSPARYAKAVDDAIAAARELGAEVVLVASAPGVSTASQQALGLSRPHADALAELAADQGLAFADLGRLTDLLQLTDLDASADEAHLFAEFEQRYRGFFHDSGSGFVARPALHHRLADLLFRELIDGPPLLPWRLDAETAVLNAEATRVDLTCTLHNPGDEALRLTALPLPAGGWKPASAEAPQTFAPRTSATLKLSYSRATPVRLDESQARLPLLLHGAGRIENAVVRAAWSPLTVVWGLETFFNQEQFIAPACTLLNPGKARLQGRWQAEYAGQKLQGDYRLEPGASQALDLRLDIAKAPPSAELRLSLDGDARLIQHRRINVTPNLGLGTDHALHAEPAALAGKASLQVQAAESNLSLLIDLADAALLDDSGTGPAWQLDFNLDARSYGQRLEGGATATLSVAGSAVDGPARVSSIPPWAFGTGYAAGFDAAALQATLATRADGRRQIRLTVPRSYFYLHEWALENGNSQIGLDVRLLLQGGRAAFHLSPSRKAADDADSLVVLELARSATRRFTVSVE